MAGVWGSQCIALLPSPIPGIVDGSGNSMQNFSNMTWGIDIETCERYCNDNNLPLTFQFQSFSNAFTNFLLPWLGLIAQLPYETGGSLTSLMSAFLSLGSPALAAYSLTLTILNRSFLLSRFEKIIKKAKDKNTSTRYQSLTARIRSVQCLLLESQQVPLRASQKDGWLSSLLVSGRNDSWWERVESSLEKTRRGTTPSFVFQISTAIIAWLLTIIASFVGALGEVSTSLQVSGGALWLWMIPILIGWILVGTQGGSDSVEKSMERQGSYRALALPITDGTYTEELPQEGIILDSCLSPLPKKIRTANGVFETTSIDHLKIPKMLLSDIAGDERQAGPVYNYARVFTWWRFTDIIEKALDTIVDNVAQGRACKQHPISDQSNNRTHEDNSSNQTREDESSNRTCEDESSSLIHRDESSSLVHEGKSNKWAYEDWDDSVSVEKNLNGDRRETANYCGLETKTILAYPLFSEIPTDIVNHMIMAAVIAIWIQWGTTGPSIMIAYLTPTVGLGCRSSAYLLYGALGTVVWVLMVISSLFSHAAMLTYQQMHREDPSIDLRKDLEKRKKKDAIIEGAAVILRFLARFLAVGNSLWLIFASLMEMVGGFDNCWCKSDTFQHGRNGWVVLFKTADDLAGASQLSLASGVALSIIVCFVAIVFFSFCRSPGR